MTRTHKHKKKTYKYVSHSGVPHVSVPTENKHDFPSPGVTSHIPWEEHHETQKEIPTNFTNKSEPSAITKPQQKKQKPTLKQAYEDVSKYYGKKAQQTKGIPVVHNIFKMGEHGTKSIEYALKGNWHKSFQSGERAVGSALGGVAESVGLAKLFI